jgi:hypothetical protein
MCATTLLAVSSGRGDTNVAEDGDRYQAFLRKVGTGATMSEAEWLFHFDHQNADARDGIAIGDPAPEFSLPDATGRKRTRTELAGPRGLLVVFARSADW